MAEHDAPRAIACFTFDNMGEAAEVGAGLAPEHPVHPSLARGYPNLFDLLERHDVRATFFVEGWNGTHHPDAVADIVRRGHELGMHGWTHEAWAGLDRGVEVDLAARATEALTRAAGVRPIGFRAPGGARSPNTESILRDLGYAYDASLGEGMRPQLLPSGLAQVPFVWSCVDGFQYLRPQPVPPNEVRDIWLRALDRAAATGGLFVLICHAFLTGVDAARLATLDAVIGAARHHPQVDIHTAAEIVAAVRRGFRAAPDEPRRRFD